MARTLVEVILTVRLLCSCTIFLVNPMTTCGDITGDPAENLDVVSRRVWGSVFTAYAIGFSSSSISMSSPTAAGMAGGSNNFRLVDLWATCIPDGPGWLAFLLALCGVSWVQFWWSCFLLASCGVPLTFFFFADFDLSLSSFALKILRYMVLCDTDASVAIFAEKSGIGRSEDRDSHDRPITRDRNDRKCHLMYKH